jgi:hypothetical protein
MAKGLVVYLYSTFTTIAAYGIASYCKYLLDIQHYLVDNVVVKMLLKLKHVLNIDITVPTNLVLTQGVSKVSTSHLLIL